MIKNELQSLKQAVDDILSSLKDGTFHLPCAYNPVGLWCVEAQKCISDHDEHTYHVIIAEASPDAWPLKQYVYDYLGDGWGNIEITTEW